MWSLINAVSASQENHICLQNDVITVSKLKKGIKTPNTTTTTTITRRNSIGLFGCRSLEENSTKFLSFETGVKKISWKCCWVQEYA